MTALWYGILALMLTTYVVLDGRNFGSGVLHWVVARSPAERRQVIAAIGPLWTWHEVWLLGTGGVMIMAFPRFMATVFSGYYLALCLVLWCILLRGISLEVGGHLHDRMWQNFWDAVFSLSNVLLAILFGAAFGNVIRGVPLAADGTFYLTFFTNFRVDGQVGLLDWYTLSVAVFAFLVLTAHGATYLAMRCQGTVGERARSLAWRLWALSAPGFVLISALTWSVRPQLFTDLPSRPLTWLTIGLGLSSAGALLLGLRQGREKLAVAGASLLIFALIMTGAAALYPTMLFSTLPGPPLEAAHCAAPERSLQVACAWWFPALALSLTYMGLIQRHYSGKVSEEPEGLY